MKSLKEVTEIRDMYQLGKKIGEGASGHVRLAVQRQLNIQCAIKIIKKETVEQSRQLMTQMVSEMQILESVSHQGILRLYDLLHDRDHVYIITEVVLHGDLLSYVSKK